MKRVATVTMTIVLVGLASCGSSGGKSQARPTQATSATTTLPLATAPQSSTTTISNGEYEVAFPAVANTALALQLRLSSDAKDCVVLAWIHRASDTERAAMRVSRQNPLTEEVSLRHVVDAFTECLTAADQHAAIVGLVASSQRKNGECVASQFETYHLAPKNVWLGLILGFDAVSPAAKSQLDATLSYCGA